MRKILKGVPIVFVVVAIVFATRYYERTVSWIAGEWMTEDGNLCIEISKNGNCSVWSADTNEATALVYKRLNYTLILYDEESGIPYYFAAPVGDRLCVTSAKILTATDIETARNDYNNVSLARTRRDSNDFQRLLNHLVVKVDICTDKIEMFIKQL